MKARKHSVTLQSFGFLVTCSLLITQASVAVVVDTPTPTPVPTVVPGVVDLGANPEMGLQEIQVNVAGVAASAKPLELIAIPAGSFTMGSPVDERGCYDEEEWLPHTVTITQPFYIGRYEVTQSLWEAVMGVNPSQGRGVGADHPVYDVSWNDCVSFIQTLNTLGLGTFRLPSEAEWEYACRAGTATRFSFGDGLQSGDYVNDYSLLLDRFMWWGGNDSYGDNIAGTMPVGLKRANAWGLHDVHGSVWEWCSDVYEVPWDRGSQIDPAGPASGSQRVLRGGDFENGARSCRSAVRAGGSTTVVGNLGLRLIWSPSCDPVEVGVLDLGVNRTTGLLEKRIQLPGMTQCMKPLDVVHLPAGLFSMGSPLDEQGRYAEEEWPPHVVTLTQPFYLGRYEITQGQWQSVMGTIPPQDRGAGTDHPVYDVSWSDCASFIQQLNTLGLGTFRLPTEAEWEYACRAGTVTRFSYGDAFECGDLVSDFCVLQDYHMWWGGNEGSGGNALGSEEVADKMLNPWGLFDMHGNVWEWCADVWESPWPRGPQTDPMGPETGSLRVFKGGDFGNGARSCRSAIRAGGTTDVIGNIGLRIAWVPADAPTPTPTPTPTLTYTPIPTIEPGVFDLGTNPESGLEEIRVVFPSMQPGERLMDMALIPAGTFIMGSPEGEEGRFDNEGPQHQVTISRPFYMAKYEITRAQCLALMGEIIGSPPNASPPVAGANRPLCNVWEWDDCLAFFSALNALGYGNFRLPTDAEWEYACRAGTTTRFYWGDDGTPEQYAWFCSGVCPSAYPPEVGLLLPNAWGLYDMSGNVEEWCSDWYGLYTADPQVDPQGPATGTGHITRGGNSLDSSALIRSAYRKHFGAGVVGIRVVMDDPTSPTPIATPAATAIITPTPQSGIVDLGTNPESGLSEIRVNLPGMLEGDQALDMALVPAGQFIMGSPDTELNRQVNEGPQHAVTITASFYIGKFEITNSQWNTVMGWTPVSDPDFDHPDQPICFVSWDDGQSFIVALNSTGLGTFRLPTEAEWEYACRAGTTTRFYWGDDLLYEDSDSYATTGFGLFADQVGTRLPNAWGLFDMSGNIAEWVGDWFGAYSSDAQTDPQGPTAGSERAFRGGSYLTFEDYCRSASRNPKAPGLNAADLGFRVVMNDPNPPTPIPTVTSTLTPTPTSIPTSTPTSTPISTLTSTLTPTPTLTPILTLTPTSTLTSNSTLTPTLAGVAGVVDLGVNPETGLQEIRVNLPDLPPGSTTLDMALFPAGEFLMGSPTSGTGHSPFEEPQHVVTISRPFYLGKYEVTEAQWISILGSLPAYYFSGGYNRPIRWARWNECQALMDELHGLGLGVFRFPTEAEWEYACRAGTSTRFYWGDDPNEEDFASYAWAGLDIYTEIDVGTLLPNMWGLYDMSGNVAEWCADWYGPYSSGPQVDPQGPLFAYAKVKRGGNSANHENACRSASRSSDSPDYPLWPVGLRLVREDPTSPTPIPTTTSTPTVTATPTPTGRATVVPGIIDLGVNSSTGLGEIRVNLPGMPEDLQGLDMALIPAGQFMMGSSDSEQGHDANEAPQHLVTITRPFYLGKYEITRAQWFEMMGWTPNVPLEVTEDHPVYFVNWNDCQSFIDAMNGTGLGTFRWPTEAEWEHACRAGTLTRYYWGDDPSSTDIGQYAKFSPGVTSDPYPNAVGQLLPNAWGMFDMSGNVLEWCGGWFGTYSPDSQIDPQGPATGTDRIIRSGSWGSSADICRSAFRYPLDPSTDSSGIGLRVVMDDPAAPTPTATPSATETTTLTPTPTLTPTVTLTVQPGVVDLGVNPESGLSEIRVNLPGMLEEDQALDMVFVPGGQFVMGSPDTELHREEHEGPQHSVTISNSFYLGKYEVTEAQWLSIAGELPPDYSSLGDDYPIRQVGWEQCQSLIEALNNLGFGYNFRFPTEAEWEYACRAGTTTTFYWGGDDSYVDLNQYAYSGGHANPTSVGTKLPNAWQLYDMSGNAYEWCGDWYGLYSPEPQVDPQGPASANFHVYRGGAHWGMFTDSRSAWRREWLPSQSEYPTGLRLVSDDPAVSTPIPTATITLTPTITMTPTPRPTLVPGVIDLGTNPETGLQEIRVDIPGLPSGAKHLDMAYLPAIGRFTMGSPDTEQDRSADEGPQHSVTISRPFYMGKYEITQAQWIALLGTLDGYSYVGDDVSVANVLWNECQPLIDALNSLGAGVFRFATEAEWEYACRAGTTTRYYWGDDPNYADVDLYAWTNFVMGTAPVGLKLPNTWGLFDMAGNASEWCGDWYGLYTADWRIDPQGPPTGNTRVLRGGSASDYPFQYRSASRAHYYPDMLLLAEPGLRVVREDHTSPTPIPTNYPTMTVTPVPTLAGGVTDLGINPETGLEEIRVNLYDLPPGAATLDMALIPAGEFLMGSPPSEIGHQSTEEPQHVVTISRPFYLGKYELTEAQWISILGSLPANYGSGGYNLPIRRARWSECQALMDELHGLGFGVFRFPTEAEWEYACRAGTTTRFYWGDDPNEEDFASYAWADWNNYTETDVGTLLPSMWGLYDMSGNVFEWCADWYGPYSPDPQVDPQGPPSGDKRIARGGYFRAFADACRSASRLSDTPHEPFWPVGLRLVREDPTSPTPIPTTTSTPTATATVTPTPTSTPTPTTDPSRTDYDTIGASFGTSADIPVALVHGDVDSDGDEDFVMGNGDGLQSQLYLNDGSGVFAQSTSVQLFAHAGVTTSLAMGDVNGDNHVDLVMGTFEGPNVVFLGDGSGNLGGSPSTEFEFGTAGDLTWAIVLGDVSGDGILDVVTGNTQQQHRVYLGDGTGAFGGSPASERVFGLASPGTTAAALGDVDGDGDLDAAIIPVRGPGTVYLNDGTGNLGGSPTMESTFGTSESHIASIGLADVDGDTDLDIVAASWYIYDSNVVYLNDGQGNFGGTLLMETTFGTDTDSAWSIDLEDVDGDGDLDAACGAMIYTPLTGQQNVIFLNNGYGTFGGGAWNEIPFGDSSDRTRSVLFVDTDGDGDLDIVAANLYQSGKVYLNSR